MTVLSVVFFLVAIGMFVATFVLAVKTWLLLNDIVNSGALPLYTGIKAKREARAILALGYINYPDKADELFNTLSRLSEDQEASELLHQLEELKDRSKGRN
jgi:hypothetical protein